MRQESLKIAAVTLVVLTLVAAPLTLSSSVPSTATIGRAMVWGFAILAAAVLAVTYFAPRLRRR